MDETDFLIAFIVAMASAIVVVAKIAQNEGKIPHHNSAMSGAQYYLEIMNTRNHNRFLEVTRMNKRTFLLLLELLQRLGGLKDSKKMTAGEKLMIFLSALKGKRLIRSIEKMKNV